jgi:hypothetical protein
VPVERGDVLALVHRECEVLDERVEGSALRLTVRVDEASRRVLARLGAGSVAEATRVVG